MDRRSFFKSGLTSLRQSLVAKAPDLVRPALVPGRFDISILTDRPDQAEELSTELLAPYFGATMLRLRQSRLDGEYPGGIVLVHDGRLVRDWQSGVLFHLALRSLADECGLHRIQTHPTVVRYGNASPPFARDVRVYVRDVLVNILPLSEDTELSLDVPHGPFVIGIRDGLCGVTTSGCLHRTCCAHPPILTPGQRITCVPNHVTLLVEGDPQP